MKFKYLVKIMSGVLILVFINCFIFSVYSANGLNINAFENADVEGTEKVTGLVNSTAGAAISIIRIVAVSIAVVMLLVIAMKYMISSPGDRADIKKHAVAYIVGAFVLFGVTGILSALVSLADTFKSGGEK